MCMAVKGWLTYNLEEMSTLQSHIYRGVIFGGGGDERLINMQFRRNEHMSDDGHSKRADRQLGT